MREYNDRFRFRVWSKEFNRFLTGEEWYLDMDGKLRFAEFPKGNGDNSADSVFTPVENPERFVIEQYTGVEDKNGKEIYEGDIVTYRGIDGMVSFIAGMFVLDYSDQTDSGPIGFLQTLDMEVVGNIYDRIQ